MKKTMQIIIDQLAGVMKREAALLKKFALAEDKIMNALSSLNWSDLQTHLAVSRSLSRAVEETEQERNTLYEKFRKQSGAVESANFYQVVEHVPGPVQMELIERFRDLKLALLQAQGMNWKIEMYVASAGGTMKELMNRLFPHRKGTLYSKEGIVREAGNNPMVLNREL